MVEKKNAFVEREEPVSWVCYYCTREKGFKWVASGELCSECGTYQCAIINDCEEICEEIGRAHV